jgi:hypothetical protein
MTDVPPLLGSWTVSVPQLPVSHSNSSQGLNCSSLLTHSLTKQLHSTNYLRGWRTSHTNLLLFSLPSQDSFYESESESYVTTDGQSQSRAEQSRAVPYCWQPASTVTLGIEPRWDPWPYICSVSRLLFFFFFFRCSSFDEREGLGFFCNWCSLTYYACNCRYIASALTTQKTQPLLLKHVYRTIV